MQALLFERPLLLIAVLAAVQFALTWHWARSRTRRASRVALTALILFPLLLALQAWVVTDRERVTAVCREMADAMDAGEVARVGSHVSPTFAVGTMDRPALLEALEGVLTRVKVEEPRLTDFEVTTDGDQARATFAASCRLVTAGAIESGMLSRWELTFRRIDRRWQVVEIRPIPTPWLPHRSLDEVIRAAGG